MTAIASRRRRRTWYALAAGLLVVVAIPVLGVAGWRAIRDSKAARDVTTSAPKIPVTPTALLGGTDADGRLTTLAMLALAPDGAGGSIVGIPVGSSVTGEDGMRHRLADRFAEGGVDQLKLDVESVMLVTIDVAEVVDAARLAALLEPVGDLTVELPSDVVAGAPPVPTTVLDEGETANDQGRESGEEATAGDEERSDEGTSTTAARRGTTTEVATTSTTVAPGELVAAAGQQQLNPEAAARVLLASAVGEPEIERLPAQSAIWEAVAAAVGSGRPGSTPVDLEAGVPGDVAALANGLWAGAVRTWQLDATPITSAADNPTGADLLLVDLAEAIMVVATVAPSASSAVLDGASVQLTTGFTDWHVTRNAIAVLVYVGANVMVVINSDEEPPQTTEVYAGTAAVQSLAEEYATALAAGSVEPVTDPVEGIDVQIVLGRSFADSQGQDTTPLESVPSRDTIDQNLVSTTAGQDAGEPGQASDESSGQGPDGAPADDETAATVES